MNDDTMEEALGRAETETTAVLKEAQVVLRELKRARGAAATGQVRDLRRSLDGAGLLARNLASSVDQLRAGYDLDATEHLGSGAYAKELLAAAEAAGVAMFEEDDRLLCYPSLVRLLPGDAAIEVDRKRDRRLRPSGVVARLKQAQDAGPRFKPEPFLASLLDGYDLEVARQHKQPGAVVRLFDVHRVLTLLPGQAREYSRQEFARDLYLLDQSGVTRAAGGRRIRWAASTGTRQPGVLMTVSRSGQQQRYWGVAFDHAGTDNAAADRAGADDAAPGS